MRAPATYCRPGGSACLISGVVLRGTTLRDPAPCTPPYDKVLPAQGNTTGSVAPGRSYELAVMMRAADQFLSAWADWNANKVFEPGEWVQLSGGTFANDTARYPLHVPADAVSGPVRLRVRACYGWPLFVNGPYDACGSSGVNSSETRDYTLTVTCALAAPTIQPGPLPTCASASLTLRAASVAPGAAYLWTGPGGFASTAVAPRLAAAVSGWYALTITVGNCSSTDSVLLALNPAPLPAAPAAPAAQRCGPGTLTLAATGGPAGGAYRWYGQPAGGVPLLTSPTFTTPALSATTTYYVSALSVAGCEGPRTAVAATVNPVPPVPVIVPGGPTTFCAGDSVQLTASGGALTWSTGATTPSITVRQAGTYSVTVANASQCTAASAPLTVIVQPLPPAPTITQQAAGGLVLLTSSATGGNQWYRDGVLIPGATGPTFSVTAAAQNGSYTVTTTDAAGCTSPHAAPHVVTVTGLLADSASGINFFPNPVGAGFLCVTFPATATPRTVVLLDATGRTVLRSPVVAGATRCDLDARALPVGVYTLRVGAVARRLLRE